MDGKKLENLLIYKQAIALSNMAWEVFEKLPQNIKFHIGNQFVDSVDSIGANIAEGFGRFHYKDSIRFYYIARGSLFEVKHWLSLLKKRKLIDDNVFLVFQNALEKEGIWINNFIKGIKSCSKES
jgi:four helix bundle protein